MATTTTTQAKRRQSYVLSYEPPKFSSLSAGTAFEVPVEELERIAAESQPQPEPKQMPGAYPAEEETSKASSMEDQSATNPRRSESRQTTSAPNKLRRRPSTQNDRDERPRKLFSLRSLRNSFSSSRSSLNLARPSQDIQSSRPMSPGPSILSGNAPAPPASQQPQSPQTLRNKRSSTWFGKRRSGFFHTDEDGRLAMVSEDPSQEGQDGKRKEDPNLPRLPEVNTLRGGEFNDGGLGWNEDIFKA